MAGAMRVRSSSPSAPCSPACGLRPAMARRGFGRPKSRARAAAVMRAVTTMASVSSVSMARRRETCTVTGTTRSSGLASIMTGGLVAWVSSARNSVWPGWAKPASYSAALLMGLVTMPPTSPRRARAAARRMEARMAGALAGSMRPGTGGAARRTGRTGRASANTAGACAGVRHFADRHRQAEPGGQGRQAVRVVQGHEDRSRVRRASQAARRISPPMPAGSPMVTARGEQAAMRPSG